VQLARLSFSFAPYPPAGESEPTLRDEPSVRWIMAAGV